jgi:hypothetical protein
MTASLTGMPRCARPTLPMRDRSPLAAAQRHRGHAVLPALPGVDVAGTDGPRPQAPCHAVRRVEPQARVGVPAQRLLEQVLDLPVPQRSGVLAHHLPHAQRPVAFHADVEERMHMGGNHGSRAPPPALRAERSDTRRCRPPHPPGSSSGTALPRRRSPPGNGARTPPRPGRRSTGCRSPVAAPAPGLHRTVPWKALAVVAALIAVDHGPAESHPFSAAPSRRRFRCGPDRII